MILLKLFVSFFKIGAFAFGGGTAMLPLIYQSIRPFGVMDATDFSDMVALSQVTPGPVAVNAATYVGLEVAGMPGAVIATVGVCLPCLIIMLIVMKLLEKFKGNPLVEGAFTGIRPVTIGLILAAVIFIAEGVLVKGSIVSTQLLDISYYNPVPVIIFAASVVLMTVARLEPIWVMLIMAAAGAVIYGVM